MNTRIQVIDSHTAGEPTRIVLNGIPPLHGTTVAELADDFQRNHDHFRQAVILEPRGSDVLVGGLIVPSSQADFGVFFFNNVGLLGMCGHGLIGVVETLHHLNRWSKAEATFETPVGIVPVRRGADGTVALQNVASFREAANVSIHVPGYGEYVGSVAWGGNWFYLVSLPESELIQKSDLEHWLTLAKAIKVEIQKIYPKVDHVELFSRAGNPANDSRNFVLCPGNAYDRSPCGTGTSAKLACLAAEDKLKPGAIWRQEGILGTVFEGQYSLNGHGILPTIRGRAYITAEATLIFADNDPFPSGIA